jgi:flagellar P-ring protein precursor FlgI
MTLVYALVVPLTAEGARLKDIADIEGVRGNQLLGYGLVVGLNGTGDGKLDFTQKSISNMLEKQGIRVNPVDIKVKNVAAVMVTANLPPFARPGSTIDVAVSSMGDAKSLQGGTLERMATPMPSHRGRQISAVFRYPMAATQRKRIIPRLLRYRRGQSLSALFRLISFSPAKSG